ncbi:N-acetylmannosamine-6-phosphate 2-epimerase [Neobacillus sp. D3-1R]|uniref:N-acetylmannosamine-6-phosphate 2-epimerase n=1 Tax=Neobacillus sp. D3-1R TaxID=3445778 RepID=UPI003FA07BFA
MDIIKEIKGGLIVSCQALEDEPLFGSANMALMARAAKEGHAVAIRANGKDDIQSIINETRLPVIGIVKRNYQNSDMYITPTIVEVDEVFAAGADAVAVDLTNRLRPDRISNSEFIKSIRCNFPKLMIMADISTYEEGIEADSLGVDLIATTLAGYTSYSKQDDYPNYDLIYRLSEKLQTPIVAEGRINNPAEAVRCLQNGAWSVVVGSAITRPQLITKRFTEKIKEFYKSN